MIELESSWGEELKGVVGQLYEALREERYKLVKGKLRETRIPSVAVTAFHHFASVAVAAAKLCAVLEDLGKLPEGSWLECFWGGAVHDYEKVSEGLLEKISEASGVDKETLEKLAHCAEALAGSKRELRLKCYALSLADYWASQRSITSYLLPERYSLAFNALEKLGLRFVPLYSGVPKAVMAKVSKDLMRLFEERGWEPLFIYADGVLFVGDEGSEKVKREEVAQIFYKILKAELRGGEAQKQSMEKFIRPFLNFAARFENFLSLNEEELKERLEQAWENEKNALLPILAVALYRGYEDLAKEIEEKIKKNKSKYQMRALLGQPYYFSEIIKQGLAGHLLEMMDEGTKKASLLAFALAFYDKDEVALLAKELGRWEAQQKKPYQPLLFAEVVARLYKAIEENEENVIEKAIKFVSENAAEDVGLKRFAEYLACEALSSPVLEGECSLELPKERCFVCGAPIFSKDFLFEHYYTYASGGTGKGAEIYLPRQPIMANVESEKVKKQRYICPACAFEASVINSKLSTPFISFATHPSVSYEVMEYVTSRLVPASRTSPSDLCKEKIVEEGKEESYLIDYAHALMLLKMQGLRKDEKGFAAHGAAIAKFLMYAGFLLETAGGGQVALSWELPAYLASEPVSVPHAPSWLTSLIEFSLRDADSLYPLIKALKAWAWKACSVVNDVNQLRDVFYYSDSVPHPILALLAPPKGFKGSEIDLYYSTFLKVLNEVREVEKYMPEEDRLTSRLWAYAYAIAEAIRKSGTKLSKHKVQGPLRTALYHLVDYLEAGLKEEDAIELAAGAAQEDAERSFGYANVEEPVKKILKFVVKYVKEMNPSKRRQFFEDILDVVYLMTKKALSRGEEE